MDCAHRAARGGAGGGEGGGEVKRGKKGERRKKKETKSPPETEGFFNQGDGVGDRKVQGKGYENDDEYSVYDCLHNSLWGT